jgi:NDP-sugar pyrophosphorylase family protein
VVGDFRGLVRVFARSGDELYKIGGPGCPYTVPVGGRPLIAHAVKAVCDAGAKRIVVAVDASIADSVAPLVADWLGAEVHIAMQPEGDDDATLRAVDRLLGSEGPLLFTSGDALPAGAKFAEGEDVIELEAAWRYDGSVDSLLDANAIALDTLKRGRVGVDLSRASVQGRVYVDPSAELDGAKLRGPVHIGPGARVVETYVGPYTSIASGVILEGVEIENSIVMRDAQLRYPGRRLEGSLVGEGAQIERDYGLPSALRLRVGPGSEIQLS